MKKIFSLIFICILLTSCTVDVNTDEVQVSTELKDISAPSYNTWQKVGQGLEMKQFNVGEQNLVSVVRVDSEKAKWAIGQDVNNPQMVSSWQEKLNADLVINGGYFDETNNSTGLLVVNKRQFGNLTTNGRNGYTGMLLIKDGKPELRYLPQNNFSEKEKIDFGLQTFPTLINQGKNLIAQDSGKTARRTVLAQDKNGQIYIVISEFFISLFQLSDWLVNSELKPQIAINLDGGPSTGLIIKTKETYYKAESAPVPNVIYLKAVGNGQQANE